MPRVRALASANSLLVTLVGLVLVWQLWVSLSRVEALIAPTRWPWRWNSSRTRACIWAAAC